MDWWDDGGFGNWSLTGPATGWNAYRHPAQPGDRSPSTPTPISAPGNVPPFSAVAMRCGGSVTWTLEDPRAGLRAVAPHGLPVTSTCPQGAPGPFDHLELDRSPSSANERWQVMADCVVRTECLRYPLVVKRRTWFPVGTFQGPGSAPPRSARPEIAGSWSRSEPATSTAWATRWHEWACWLETLLDGSDQSTPRWQPWAAKSWSRTVAGEGGDPHHPRGGLHRLPTWTDGGSSP